MAPAQGVIASRYARMVPTRQPYIDRARECAKLTIPSLFPEEGQKTSKIIAPYQGVGARGVNNLAAKLMLGLFPPNVPFFRLAVDDFRMAELAQNPDVRGEVEAALGKIERAIMIEVETTALRVPIYEAVRHLIVAGNNLLFRDPETGKSRAYPLTNYVVRRDPLGNVLEIIVREDVGVVTLPDDIRATLQANGSVSDADPDFASVPLFTRVVREPKRWAVSQEAGGVPIPQSAGAFPLDRCPWLPLRMVVMDGEDYGRSYVEEHFADLQSLEKLTKALVQFAAASAKVVFGVRPNATTKVRALAKAASGDFVEGDLEKDITTLQLDKTGDFQVTATTSDKIEERLAYAFMLNSALQRNGERVTAEEIRRLAQELDVGVGGIHALLAQELQLPLVAMLMASKAKRGELPKLPKDFVKPMIVTGVDALGRGTDLENLMTAFNALSAIPNAIQRVKGAEAGNRVFASLQINSDGLFMSDEEVAQQQQQQTMADMAKAGTPAMAKAIAEGQAPQ